MTEAGAGLTSVRVIVCGDRSWDCAELADRIVERLRLRSGRGVTIVHGCASGVDRAFARAAEIRGLPVEPHPAAWEVHGQAAGPMRNQAMIEAGAAFCVAVHRDLARSRGSRDMVGRCLKVGIPVYLIDREDGQPRRITRIEEPEQRSWFDESMG